MEILKQVNFQVIYVWVTRDTVHGTGHIMIMFQSYVKLTNARNVQLHVSYNGMGNSEAEIEIEKAFNSTVHLSFQVRRGCHVGTEHL